MNFVGQMQLYFRAEKSESLLFILVGLVAIAIACWCWFGLRTPFYRGMVIPLCLVALVQVMVGSTVYFRTNAQVFGLNTALQSDPGQFQADEVARMKTVMANFRIYKMVEAVLIVTGLILMFIFNKRPFWEGFGLALLSQSVFMIVLDVFAERRGFQYIETLNAM